MTTDVIEHYEKTLGSFGRVVDFDVSSLDRLGFPVTSCSLVVDGRFAALANGYGSSADAARVGVGAAVPTPAVRREGATR